MLENKYTRFFLLEPHFKKRLIWLCLLVVFIGLEVYAGRFLSRRQEQLKERKVFVEKMARLEKEFLAGKKREARRQDRGEDFLLQGISEQQGVPLALINDDIYNEGDMIHDYRVSQIEPNAVVLKNEASMTEKHLYLYANEVR